MDAAFNYLVNPRPQGRRGSISRRPGGQDGRQNAEPGGRREGAGPGLRLGRIPYSSIRHVQKLYGWDKKDVYAYANDYIYAVDFDERLKKVAKVMMLIAGDERPTYSASTLWMFGSGRTRRRPRSSAFSARTSGTATSTLF